MIIGDIKLHFFAEAERKPPKLKINNAQLLKKQVPRGFVQAIADNGIPLV